MVIDESDLDALAGRLSPAGLHHGGPQPATASRVLILTDPDGNQVVIGAWNWRPLDLRRRC